ncbi:AraC family transcriptional regulator [Sphingomonas aquatica]|uniref:AraC family transcriptional regulator n=1 Tax=Sphingomonas aquatica TaxID=1763824 RepID=UPI00301E56D9
MGRAADLPIDIRRPARQSPWQWGDANWPCEAFPIWGDRIYLDQIGIQRSCLPEFELHLVVPRHVAEFCVNDFDADFALDSDRRQSVRFSAGSAGFAPKGASLFRASTHRPDRPRLHKFIGISFDGEVVDSLFSDIVNTAAIDYAIAPTPAMVDPLQSIGAAINAAFDMPDGVAALTLEALSHQYIMQTLLRWSNIAQHIRRPSCAGKHPGIARCIDYIHANVARSIRLSDLAVIAGMGIDSLTRHFRQATNRTPHDYIVAQRVALACKLLRDEDRLPLDVIARHAGFSSQCHMTTAFRRQIGQTPGHWLKQAGRQGR